MSISVVCPEGHRLQAKEKLAGKTLQCPKCGQPVVVPSAESDVEAGLAPVFADEPSPDGASLSGLDGPADPDDPFSMELPAGELDSLGGGLPSDDDPFGDLQPSASSEYGTGDDLSPDGDPFADLQGLSEPAPQPAEPAASPAEQAPAGGSHPGIEQLGSHNVELFASVDGARHRLRWSVHVTRPFLEVPFEVSGGLELSADGRRALLWGDEVLTTGGSWYAKVAVVDVDSLRILASREMESLFSVATIVEDEVYVVSPEHVERLAAATLEVVPASRPLPAGGRGWWHACALDDGRSIRFRPADEKTSAA